MLLYDQIFSRYQKRHAEENWKISYHIADKTIGAVLPNDKRLIFFIQTKDDFWLSYAELMSFICQLVAIY